MHYLAGSEGKDVEAVDIALEQSQACLPPVALCEVLSDPRLSRKVERLLLQIPTLGLEPDFWVRAGRLRARVIGAGRKAKLADTLIAQTCLDHDVPLITRDDDFRVFLPSGLRLLPE